MSSDEIRVAFPASELLRNNIDRFINAVDAAPSANHSALLEPAIQEFLDRVLDAFFHGPVRAVGARGRSVNVINSVVSVISKASHGMASRLVGKSSPAEQQALAEHFRFLRLEMKGQTYVSFPLEAALANRMILTFEEFEAGQGEIKHLVEAMRALADGAVAHFLDGSIACMNLGALNRGLVATARATILKSSHMAIEKALPAMEAAHRKPVLRYFRGMLLTAPG